MNTQTKISHKNVLESMPFGVIQVDLSGIVIYANSSAFKLLGVVNESELLGIHYHSFQWDQFGKDCKPLKKKDHALYNVLHEEEVVTSRVQGTLVDGKRRWFSVNAAPIYDDENRLAGGISNFADITDKIEDAAKQQQDADRYRILVENINAVVWETNIGSQTFSYISPKVNELFGFPQKDWLKEGFWQSRIYEKDKEHVIAYERHKVSDVESYQLEYRIVHKDGSLIWVRDLVEVVKVGNEPKILRGLMLDITDRKNARLLLKESEQRYKQMITEAPYAISIYDSKGTLIAANDKCAEYWHVDLNEYIGKFNIFENDLFTEESQIRTINRAFNGESGEVSAKIPLSHSGDSKHYRIKYYPLLNTSNELDNVVYITEDISEYIEAQEKVKQEESLKQGILDALDEAILVVDENGVVISINKNLRSYVKNRSFAKLNIGKSVFDFIKYFDESDFLMSGLKSILDQKVRVLDHEIKLADGIWYNMRATPLDMPFGAVISWQNINTRKEIEMALEKSLKKYRNIYNKAPVMMHSINEKLEIVSVSDFWLEKMGYESQEVIGKTPVDFLSEDSMGAVAGNLKKLFSEGSVKNVEYRYKKKSGELMDVLLSAVAEYDENGNFERSITGMLDVTDLKAAEQKLQESQFKLLESQRISKIANYEYDALTGGFEPSEEMVSMMGFTESQRDISIIQDLIHPEDVTEFASKLEKCIKEGKDFFHIYRIKHIRTGKVKWISGRGKMIKNEKGKVKKMIGTVQDITEQKSAEQKIKRLTDRILLATEIANLGVWEYDRETDEIFWEDQMYSIFSNTKKPLPLVELKKYLINDKEVIGESLHMIRSGINFLEGEMRVMVDSEEKYLRSFTRILRDHKGKLRGMVGVIYDITVDKKLQMQLESSLEEKNVLIKEVHHRVKNNMQLISSILALKSYDLDNDKSKAIFDEVNQRIKAMSVIHDNLYTFNNVSEIDIGDYLRSISNKLQIIQGTAQIEIEVHSEKIILDVEKALLIGLVVSELVGNAIKHGFTVDGGGKIEIHFSRLDKKYILEVLNNGKKIPKDVLDSNTGLGVSLVKTFTNQLMGKVEVCKKNGFKVSF